MRWCVCIYVGVYVDMCVLMYVCGGGVCWCVCAFMLVSVLVCVLVYVFGDGVCWCECWCVWWWSVVVCMLVCPWMGIGYVLFLILLVLMQRVWFRVFLDACVYAEGVRLSTDWYVHVCRVCAGV